MTRTQSHEARDVFLKLCGGAALSGFRKQKLLSSIQQQILRVTSLETRYWYFVHLNSELDTQSKEKLNGLLNEGQACPSVNDVDTLYLVVPRFGTISPWSSKATDIIRRCGIVQVERVERGVGFYINYESNVSISSCSSQALSALLHDPMTESVLMDLNHATRLFEKAEPAPLSTINILSGGRTTLEQANAEYGFALSDDEIEYLIMEYGKLNRNPTDVELMMFAQVNSEHCRHKIFNANWIVDRERKQDSLFTMIRNTHQQNSAGTLVAYNDNAAILEGSYAARFFPNPDSGQYSFTSEEVPFLAKVETHNHPTAIAPFPGAATGAGGEIRDEGATGRGGKPKAGVTGFAVSHLRIPDSPQPWETVLNKPSYLASPLQIMLEGPIGGASFNNEFGRPNLGGYFRSFELTLPGDPQGVTRGYHKPIMIAGGIGNVRLSHTHKQRIPAGTAIVVLGGPAMLIGLGGGAASSMTTGSSSEELDFASVQRSNPEMQRRCQEVIDRCWERGVRNPILSIHDVGAGGLSNALPELVNDAEKGGQFQLRDILNDDPGMTPMQIWCNEAQERYVLAVARDRLADFDAICARERCLYSVAGFATETKQLVVTDEKFVDEPNPVDVSLEMLLGKPPKAERDVKHFHRSFSPFDTNNISLNEAIRRVLQFPAVADKSFLINISDRSITGLVCRDQFVGPWQVAVADVAVTAVGFESVSGEAMAMGERPPLALISPAASARMAVAEAVTNIAAADVSDISSIKLSANWMAAAGQPGEDAALYDAVFALGKEFCPALGIAIPVGKDSMSMNTQWQDGAAAPQCVTAPLSLNITAFSRVQDVRKTLTPVLDTNEQTTLLLIDLGKGKNRLGGSVFAQTYSQIGDSVPDVDSPAMLRNFFDAIGELRQSGSLLAYHDRSDGGLLITLLEMAFASHCGLSIVLTCLEEDVLASLFNEEAGAVVQVRSADCDQVLGCFERFGLPGCVQRIAAPLLQDEIRIFNNGGLVYSNSRTALRRQWSETSWRLQRMRDNPESADQEYDRILDCEDPGIHVKLSFEFDGDSPPVIVGQARPDMAILRDQGINGHTEMAAAFHKAGFDAVDVTMTDLLDGRRSLRDFAGFVACGGFSYGDVLGAGLGWAKSILYNAHLHDEFAAFFDRADSFALGVCNGCQMMSGLKSMIPGAECWPRFLRNESEQFEARFVSVEIVQSPSVFFKGMSGSVLSVATAHGEGRAVFDQADELVEAQNNRLVSMRYVDNQHQTTQRYPYNPNGSVQGVTGFTSTGGRFNIMMPHPERVVRSVNHSWHPAGWGEYSPWLKMFLNAREFVN